MQRGPGLRYGRLDSDPDMARRESLERPTIRMRTGTLWTTAVSDHPSNGPCHLLIISRHHPGLYEYVRQRFASEGNVQVILDRRRGRDRRTQRIEPGVERRTADRRTRPDVDAALRMESMQFLTIPRPVAPEGDPTAGSP